MVDAALDRPRDLLTDHRTHRSAEESEVHHCDHNAAALHEAEAGKERVLLAGLALCIADALAVRTLVDELERVDGNEAVVKRLVGSRVEQLLHAHAGADAQMMLAFGANPEVRLDGLLEQRLLARGTLHPKAFGHALLGNLREVGLRPGRFSHGGSLLQMTGAAQAVRNAWMAAA